MPVIAPLAACPGLTVQFIEGVALKNSAEMGLVFVAADVTLAVAPVTLLGRRRAAAWAESKRVVVGTAAVAFVLGTEAATAG